MDNIDQRSQRGRRAEEARPRDFASIPVPCDSLDARLPASGIASCAAGGISLTGKNLYIRRVRVLNFGSNRTDAVGCAISAARAHSSNPIPPFNAVIEQCRVDSPSPNNDSGANIVALRLGVTSSPGFVGHQNCVIRDCCVDGNYPTQDLTLRGIAADGGNGTIVEGNRVLNCLYGFDTLIIRGNRIRPIDGVTDPGTTGIEAESVTNLTIDQNIVDVTASADAAVSRGSAGGGSNAGGVQVFNNRRSDGTFIPVAINTSSPRPHEAELTTDAELMVATL